MMVTMAGPVPLSGISKSSAEHNVTLDNQTPVYLAFCTFHCTDVQCVVYAVQSPGIRLLLIIRLVTQCCQQSDEVTQETQGTGATPWPGR